MIDGKPVAAGIGISGVYWKDLPGLAIMFREYAVGMTPPILLHNVHLKGSMLTEVRYRAGNI